jgi:chemotaxis protein MotB
MTTNAKPVRPIIVIKKKISHGGHHGGAWKVAYADFVTAMMSLFIVLWLLNSTPQIKKAVAGYFNDPSGTQKETGTAMLGAGESVSIDKKNVEKLKDEIQKAILKQADLTKLSKQVEITVTSEGLRIELIEDSGGTFFESGSPKLSGSGVALLSLLADQLKALPNRLLIEGHTDAQPYSSDTGYTNWELSSDRANSARRLLQQGGVGHDQISQVRGYADQSLRVPANPLDPSNRRISLIVQWTSAGPATPGSEPTDADAHPAAPGSEPTDADAHPAAPAPSTAASSGAATPPAPANVGSSPEVKAAASPPAAATQPQPAPSTQSSAAPAHPPAASSLLARIKALVPGKSH